MLIVLTILTIWVLLNILFVLIVVPPRKARRQPMATTLSPAPIDPSRRDIEQDEPFSVRQVVARWNLTSRARNFRSTGNWTVSRLPGTSLRTPCGT